MFSRLWRRLSQKPASDQPSLLMVLPPSHGEALRQPTGIALFLDIDGVCHPCEHETLEFLPAFEALMASFPSVDVVISSDWRATMPVTALIGLFSPSFQHRILGSTPDFGCMSRHKEIVSFVTNHGIRKWIAVDDSAKLFPGQCEYLFLTDRCTGLDAATLETLRLRLEALTGIPMASGGRP